MVGLLFGQVGCGIYFPFLLVAAGVGVAFSVVGSFIDNGRALDSNSTFGQKKLFKVNLGDKKLLITELCENSTVKVLFFFIDFSYVKTI